LMMENKVTVTIFGEEYPITGSVDPAHISKIADYVDSRMKDVARKSNIKAREKVAILTALSLASELQEKSVSLKENSKLNDSSLDALLLSLDAALVENPPTKT